VTDRAIYNPDVIAEWDRICAASRRKSRLLWYVLGVCLAVALLVPLSGLVAFFPYVLVVGFLALWASSALRFGYQAILECPNCGESPVHLGRRIPLYDVDYCPHCYHWLRSPQNRGGAA